MKTLSAYIITQNSADIICYALYAPLMVCDEVVIVNGGSSDKTEEVIWNFSKKLKLDRKIKYCKNRFVDLSSQRNYALHQIQTDYAMYIDSDEIITTEHLLKIKKYIEQYKLILVNSYHYYIDFWHHAVGGNWDLSYKMPRCFEIKYDQYYESYEPSVGDHTLIVNATYFLEYQNWKNNMIHCDKNDVVIHHLGHALGRENEERKIRFFLGYDNPHIPETQYDDIIKNNGYFDDRFWRLGINADPKGIIKFTGKHPEILKKHPLYNIHIIKD